MLKLCYQQVYGGKMMKKYCNWQCTPPPRRVHQRSDPLLCALHAQVSLRSSRTRLLYSKLFSDNTVRPTMLWKPTSLLFNQHRGYSPGHEANHSPPSTAKVRNSRSYTSTTPHVPLQRGQERYLSFLCLVLLCDTIPKIRFHSIFLYAVCANIHLSYTFKKFTRNVFYITF